MLLYELNHDALISERADNLAQVFQAPGEPIRGMDHDGIAFSDILDERLPLWALGVFARGIIGEGSRQGQPFELPLRVLLEGTDAAIAKALVWHKNTPFI